MIKTKRIFSDDSRGNMLVELLLSVALVAIALPFIFQYQHNAISRAENIAVVRQMSSVQSALELYIVENRAQLSMTVGNNIARVDISELAPYGLDTNIIDTHGDKYQLRVLSSPAANGTTALQGVVVLNDGDITPMRTRQIVEMSDNRMGMIEDNTAYGAFGAWHAATADLGTGTGRAIVAATDVNRDRALYLWRVPSDNPADATMMAGLSLGGHDMLNATLFNATSTNVSEVSAFGATAANTVVFDNNTAIDGEFTTTHATVSGTLSSDGRSIQVNNKLNLANTGNFSNFTVGDLWTTNLTLSGLSIYDTSRAAILNVNGALDMTKGRVDAMYITVGFTGSVTPRLVVGSTVYDTMNPEYYWDADNGVANFHDVSFTELNTLASFVVASMRDTTQSYHTFAGVAANKNATVADFMNAITEIQKNVRAKYHRLNLE